MGLDITAYSKLVAIRPLTREERGEGEVKGENLVTLWHFNSDFPNHQGSLAENTAYACEDEYGFRAGSYGGYNEWRNELAMMVGHESAKAAWANGADGKPFFELINFSDCEGIIGPEFSAKLAKDFRDNQAKADAYRDSDGESPWFREKYADWRKAFELAADGGAVEFH